MKIFSSLEIQKLQILERNAWTYQIYIHTHPSSVQIHLTEGHEKELILWQTVGRSLVQHPTDTHSFTLLDDSDSLINFK